MAKAPVPMATGTNIGAVRWSRMPLFANDRIASENPNPANASGTPLAVGA
jgi:hypothetical protein